MLLSPSTCHLLLVVAGLLQATLAQNTTTSAQDATAFALLYGYPLLAFLKLAGLLVPGFHANTFFHNQQLSGPGLTAVVRPNADTLYSVTIYDLSQTDVSLTIPEIPDDQFALFSFYDPYGDNYANLGTGNLKQAGQYLLRLRGTGPYGVQLANDTSSSSNYTAYVNSPSYYGTLLVRTLVNATNLNVVNGYQNGYVLRNISRTDGASSAPPIDTLTLRPSNTTSPALNVLELLSQYAAWDQPETNAGIAEVQQQLSAAGISNGTSSSTSFSLQPGVDLDAANQTAANMTYAAITNSSNSQTLNNGWSIITPSVLGNFVNGTLFGVRNAVASGLYLGLQSPNAIYPAWSNSSDSSTGAAAFANADYYLGPNDSYLYTFSARPTIVQPGFWSLTAYEGGYLIPNPIDVYQVGDRSNLTFPNGTRVYPGTSSAAAPFQILVQPADRAPPQNWTGNWLPGPAGGGNMSVALRWYGAGEALLNGSYVYPKVTKQAAIIAAYGTTGGNGTGTGTGPSSTSVAPSTSPSTSGARGDGLSLKWMVGVVMMVALAAVC